MYLQQLMPLLRQMLQFLWASFLQPSLHFLQLCQQQMLVVPPKDPLRKLPWQLRLRQLQRLHIHLHMLSRYHPRCLLPNQLKQMLLLEHLLRLMRYLSQQRRLQSLRKLVDLLSCLLPAQPLLPRHLQLWPPDLVSCQQLPLLLQLLLLQLLLLVVATFQPPLQLPPLQRLQQQLVLGQSCLHPWLLQRLLHQQPLPGRLLSHLLRSSQYLQLNLRR